MCKGLTTISYVFIAFVLALVSPIDFDTIHHWSSEKLNWVLEDSFGMH